MNAYEIPCRIAYGPCKMDLVMGFVYAYDKKHQHLVNFTIQVDDDPKREVKIPVIITSLTHHGDSHGESFCFSAQLTSTAHKRIQRAIEPEIAHHRGSSITDTINLTLSSGAYFDTRNRQGELFLFVTQP